METPDRELDVPEESERPEQDYDEWRQDQIDDLNEALKDITRSLGGV